MFRYIYIFKYLSANVQIVASITLYNLGELLYFLNF